MKRINDSEFEGYLRAAESASVLHVDTEGSLDHPHSETWGLSFSAEGVANYFPINHMIGDNLPVDQAKLVCEVVDNHSCISAHNLKHDIRALRNLGIDRRGKRDYCTMIMDHMINENQFSYKLEHVGKRRVGRGKLESKVMNSIIDGLGWECIPSDMMHPYATEDAILLEDIFNDMYPEFTKEGYDGEYWNWMSDFIWVMADIEDTGIIIDQKFCSQELERGLGIMAKTEKSLGFNPGSPNQLGKFLLEDLQLAPSGRMTKGGKHSFDKQAMEFYDEQLSLSNDDRARQILTYKGWSKSTGSSYRPYLEKLSTDGRFRGSYKIHGTKNGRMSCGYFQQIPRASENDWNGNIKPCFLAPEGYTAWEADYRQLEFRLTASYSKETKLLAIFNDPTRDFFDESAALLNMTRQNVKTLWYLLNFTGGPRRIQSTFGVTFNEAKNIYNTCWAQFPGIRRISDYAETKARARGYVANWAGRKRTFQSIESEAHKAFNSIIQGGAFEIVKRAMVRGYRKGLITSECMLDLQVHDSIRLIIENGKEDEYLPEWINNMEDVQPNFGVSFPVEVKKWGTNEKYMPRS